MSNFDENGKYNKTNWKTGDELTADKLNKIEDAVEIINNNDIEKHKETDERLDALEEQNETVEESLNNKADKSEIPIKISQLENDKNYLTEIPSEYITETELNNKGYLTEHIDISGKVDKINGKGLSTNDYTTEEKNKLNNIEENANNYTHPTTHNASIITQDSTHRFVSDEEKNNWNNKSNFSGNYNDLTNKPTIPTVTNDLTNTLKTNYDVAYNHSQVAHSPSNAQKNSDITKSEIEEKLTGNITSHTHNQYLTEHQDISNLATEDYVNSAIKEVDITDQLGNYIKTVNGVAPNENGNVVISATLEPPTVVDSIEEMVDTNKQYVLSTDGFIYAYKQSEEVTTPNFTNLADISGSDWLTGYRLSTSATSSSSGSHVTNYIPCKLNDIIRIKGMHIDYYSSSTAHKSRLHVLKSDKTLVVTDCGYVTGLVDAGYVSSDGDITTVTAGYAGSTSTTIKEYSSTAYERFCGYLMDGYTLNDVIITVNEEITYTNVGGYAWTSTGISYTSTDYSGVIQEIQNDIDSLEATISNLDGTSIPSYWVSELKTKSDTIQQAMETVGRNKSAFFWYTDAHWQNNAKNSPLLLDYLIKNTPINKVNFGGDIIGDPSPYDHTNIKSFYDWRKAIANIPNHHSVYGNHDLNHWTTDVHNISYALVLAHEESGNMVVSDVDGCYYIDCPSEKTRYLYLSYLTKSQTDMMAQGQFVVDSIKDVKEGWHIVAIAHRWFQYTSSSNPTVGSTPAYETEILDIFDKYNARTARNSSNYFYEQDFTDCKGKVEFCIGGHIHVDYDFTSPGGIPVIITASDTNQERAGGEDEDCGVTGTITEQAVYAIVADYAGGKINVIGIGRGGSREIPFS